MSAGGLLHRPVTAYPCSIECHGSIENTLRFLERCGKLAHMRYMFVEKPNTSSVKKVPAFMYGNGVPIERAVQCFNACNRLNSYYVSHAMHDWQFIWDRNHYMSHIAEYYSVFQTLGWTSGEALDKQEAAWPEVSYAVWNRVLDVS